MNKFFLLLFFLALVSCSKKHELNYVKSISFSIDNDVYTQGVSDSENPFIYYASGNDKIYKYYLNSNKIDSIDLLKETSFRSLSRYGIVFQRENFLVNQSNYVYSSKLNKIYNLDSLNSYKERLQFVMPRDNSNVWSDNKLLISNWFHCDISKDKVSDRKEWQRLCDSLNMNKPSYSVLNLDNGILEYSTINLNTLRTNEKFTNTLSLRWAWNTSLFVNNKVLHNNNFIDAVYEIDSIGNFKKAFDIKSKYTQFEKNDKELKFISVLDYARDYATRVINILVDDYRDKILVILVHGTDDIENYPEKKLTNRPFSILVYNNNYQFENEYLLNEKYNYKYISVCKEGLIINANNNLDYNYKPGQLIYEIFSY